MQNAPDTLYRFRPLDDSLLEREIAALRDSYLWSPRFSEMNDPMEAYYELGDDSDAVLDLILPGSTARLPDLYTQLDSIFKSLCLISFGTTHQNSAMWAYYGSNHAGMCLEFDRQLLELGDLRGEKLVPVEYSDVPLPKLSFLNLDNLSMERMTDYVSRKRTEWIHEQEWRFVTGSNGKKHYLENALRRVYIGARAARAHVDLVLLALKGRPVEVLQAKIVGLNMQFELIQPATPLAESERVGAGVFKPEQILSYAEPDLRKFLSVPYEDLLTECEETIKHPNTEQIQAIDVADSDPKKIYFWTRYKLRSGRELYDRRYFDREMRLLGRDIPKL
jgi:Protein of unknown function (DUF2971)